MYNPMNNNRNNEINFLLIGVSVVVGLIILVIIYYVYTYTSTSVSSSVKLEKERKDILKEQDIKRDELLKKDSLDVYDTSSVSSNQVFNIADNIFTYDDAEALCRAYGAELADYNQLVDAFKKGANWCNYGWTKGQLGLYPIQKDFWNKLQENDNDYKKIACGVPGINGGYFENKNLQFGVNCYGPKRTPKGDERIKNIYVSDKERELQQKVMNFRKQMGNLTLYPFNEDRWNA
jgi:hypothetical protein